MRDTMARPSRPLGTYMSALVPARGRRLARKTLLTLTCLVAGAGSLAGMSFWNAPARADGETRSLSFFHTHRRDNLTVTFRRNGRYDDQALGQLNWYLRDWRNDEPAKMDPRLFDVLWEVYRESGSRQPIHIISSYRSPETNAALRRRSSGVAEQSQHMLGKAMDIRLPDVSTEQLRAVAMRMQYGGVGYYASSNFVHVDTGSVRAWPRMTQQQLVRLFPDGKTAHLPADGRPLPGYEQARAQIAARNSALATQASAGGGSIGSLLANVFGKKTPPQPQPQAPAEQPTVLASVEPEKIAPPVPLPPQRPQAAAFQTAAIEPPRRPSDPIPATSPPAKTVSSFEPILGFNEKAAVRSLFEPKTAMLDTGFASGSLDELSAARFTGPAIKPIPRLEQQEPKSLWAKAG